MSLRWKKIISKWGLVTGAFEKTLLAIVTPPAEFYGVLLYKAMKGVGTNEDELIRVIITQRERHLAEINTYFLHTHKKSLKHWIKDECSGNFQKALVALIEYYAEEPVSAIAHK